jgi:branched-chain amino acid transport system substrate-binding protein
MEARGLEKQLAALGIKKYDFLAVNTDWGRGAVGAFGEVLKRSGAEAGNVEFMDQAATDLSAQLTKIKNSGADTLLVTTSVEQITLLLKQAQELRLNRRIVTTGGSSSPSQLIKHAGAAAEGSYHVLVFLPWFPEAMPDPKQAKAFVDEWNKRGLPFDGLTEGFRGVDAMLTAAEAIRIAGKADPKAIQAALWKVNITGVNGPIRFEKDGPAGKESGQNKPSIFMVQIRDGKVVLPKL